MSRRDDVTKRSDFLCRCGLRLFAALFVTLAPLIWAHPAKCDELTENWTSVRALGMGNAYTAIVDDSDSIFYNPAGLARSGLFDWTILDPRLGANGTAAYSTFSQFSGSGDLAQTLGSLYGQPIWAGGGSKTALSIMGLGVAAFAGTDVSGHLSNPAYPVMDLKYFADYGFSLGFGFDFVPGFAKVGLNAKRITRVGTAAPIGVSTLATLNTTELEQQLKNRGTGYGLDLGFVLTVPSPIRPSVSFVWKNIGYTSFEKEGGASAPARIPPEMILGAAFEINLPLISITPAIDYKYFDRDDVQLGKKIHMGVEIDLPLIDIRAGLHQGYYTLGVGLGLGLVNFDVATYGVELGEYPGQKEDRRYIAQVSMGLGFGGGGGGSGGSSDGRSGSGGSSGGMRRKLKQRR